MHDIDRTQLEGDMEYGEYGEQEYGEFETGEFEFGGELQEVFGEAEQMELAGELLEIRDEQELNQFLGNLIRKAGSAVGAAINSPLGQQLGGILKSSARNAALQAVPVLSDAIGARVGGGLGSSIAKGLTAFGTSALGGEYETPYQQDREFEGARQFVQLAADTVKNAVAAAPGADPRTVAHSAFVQAAEAIAPGLLQASRPANATTNRRTGRSGVWYRRGNRIILQGA
jgi:hypothetical protein